MQLNADKANSIKIFIYAVNVTFFCGHVLLGRIMSLRRKAGVLKAGGEQSLITFVPLGLFPTLFHFYFPAKLLLFPLSHQVFFFLLPSFSEHLNPPPPPFFLCVSPTHKFP